jgi:hypothetical protein
MMEYAEMETEPELSKTSDPLDFPENSLVVFN